MRLKNVATDLWKFVRVGSADECWLWQRGKDKFGYGSWTLNGKQVDAHRVAYELRNGPIPDGLCVLHRCDNPPCCNPAHLFLGTRGDNNRDRHQKGRNAKQRDLPTGDDHWSKRQPEKIQRGEEHSGAKLTEVQVIEIRAAAEAGGAVEDLATRFGVTAVMIHRITTGRAWSHVGGPLRKMAERSKLTPDNVRAIRAAFSAGEPRTPLAAKYGLDYGTITAIVTGRTWKHVL